MIEDDMSNGYENKMMSSEEYVDKEIRCLGCQQVFIWDISEQKFFKELGYKNAPARCVNCRKKRREGRK